MFFISWISVCGHGSTASVGAEKKSSEFQSGCDKKSWFFLKIKTIGFFKFKLLD